MMQAQTRYAQSGTVSIAYQVSGSGPVDLVWAQGWLSNLDRAWDSPDVARFIGRLAGFARLIRFDRRGQGLSDRDVGTSTLEERADDIRAVMDAAGSERAVLFGVSEGGFMASMFAATYPERTLGMILYGCFAKGSRGPDYPWGLTDAEREAQIAQLLATWGSPFNLDSGAPSVAGDAAAREWFGAYLRSAASPGAAMAVERLRGQIDIRPVLRTVAVPTLVLHRTGDQWIDVAEGRYIAGLVPGARFVELPGGDHIPFWGETEPLIGEIEEFVTGHRRAAPTERVLLTVLMTDIVGSTALAARLGDAKWKDLLGAHDAVVRRLVAQFDGREVKATGDGFLLSFTGPTRAIQCARAIHAEAARIGLEVRAGLHTGECERRGEDLSGLAVHLAARTSAEAGAGETLVTGTVRDLVVGSGIGFEGVGARVLKGIPGEWPLYRVTGP
jgi:pimeloyl-ACP methyl ester carboxylesterase/class 3 adenylate cyclase